MNISPQELREARDYLGKKQSEMAEIVGCTPNTWAMWERGERPIAKPTQRLIILELRAHGWPPSERKVGNTKKGSGPS